MIGDEYSGPWLIVGDFNMLLNPADKLGRIVVASSSRGGLRKLINDHAWIDLGFEGSKYTWSNRRQRNANIQD